MLASTKRSSLLPPSTNFAAKKFYNVFGQSPRQRASLAEAAEAAHRRWLGDDGQPTARKVENVSRLSSHTFFDRDHIL